MRSEELSLDNCSQRQVVKELREHLPHVVIFVLAHAFVIKAVILSDASGFMVASQNGESLFVSDL